MLTNNPNLSEIHALQAEIWTNMSMQESISTNEEQMQSNISCGIGSCIIDISIPKIFEEEVEEESVCFNCHRTQHSFLKVKSDSGDLK